MLPDYRWVNMVRLIQHLSPNMMIKIRRIDEPSWNGSVEMHIVIEEGDVSILASETVKDTLGKLVAEIKAKQELAGPDAPIL